MAGSETAPPTWAQPAVVAAVVLVAAAAKLWVSAATGLVLDEAYYTLWSFHLAPSYLDHPPMVALQIALGRLIAGDTELAVRLIAVLNGVIVAAAIHRMGVLLFDRKTAALATIWYTTTSAAGLLFLTTPDSPAVLLWTLTLWAIAEFVAGRNANWWLLAGLFAGLGLASKLTNGFLPIGIGLFLLSSRERRGWLKLWQPWAAIAIAALAFSPVLWWNVENQWATVLFQGQRIVGGDYMTSGFLANLGDLVGSQILAGGPVLFVCAIIAAVVLFRRQLEPMGLALTVFSALPIIVFMLQQTIRWRVEANWPVAVWPALALAAAAMIATHRHWAAALLRWVQVAIGVAAVGLIYVQALWQPFDAPAIDRTREMRGWRELQLTLAEMAESHDAQWIATAHTYGLAAEMWTYGRFNGNALPAYQIDQPERYAFLQPLDFTALGPALYVEEFWGAAPKRETPGGSTYLGVVERRHDDDVLGRYGVWLTP